MLSRLDNKHPQHSAGINDTLPIYVAEEELHQERELTQKHDCSA